MLAHHRDDVEQFLMGRSGQKDEAEDEAEDAIRLDPAAS